MKTFADVWDESKYGEPDESVDPTLTSYEGFHLGDSVVAKGDGDEDNGEYFFAGDMGVVIGFAKFEAGLWYPEPRTEAMVAFEGLEDPVGVLDPYGTLDNLSR